MKLCRKSIKIFQQVCKDIQTIRDIYTRNNITQFLRGTEDGIAHSKILANNRVLSIELNRLPYIFPGIAEYFSKGVHRDYGYSRNMFDGFIGYDKYVEEIPEEQLRAEVKWFMLKTYIGRRPDIIHPDLYIKAPYKTADYSNTASCFLAIPGNGFQRSVYEYSEARSKVHVYKDLRKIVSMYLDILVFCKQISKRSAIKWFRETREIFDEYKVTWTFNKNPETFAFRDILKVTLHNTPKTWITVDVKDSAAKQVYRDLLDTDIQINAIKADLEQVVKSIFTDDLKEFPEDVPGYYVRDVSGAQADCRYLEDIGVKIPVDLPGCSFVRALFIGCKGKVVVFDSKYKKALLPESCNLLHNSIVSVPKTFLIAYDAALAAMKPMIDPVKETEDLVGLPGHHLMIQPCYATFESSEPIYEVQRTLRYGLGVLGGTSMVTHKTSIKEDDNAS